jgi:hypothetical protein
MNKRIAYIIMSQFVRCNVKKENKRILFYIFFSMFSAQVANKIFINKQNLTLFFLLINS